MNCPGSAKIDQQSMRALPQVRSMRRTATPEHTRLSSMQTFESKVESCTTDVDGFF
jgi:hypothetical protein